VVPPLGQLDANALVSLDLLLQERSVTRAARRQRVTQSAMSQTLRRLRDVFDDQLLVRSGAGMVLTPRAAALREPLHRLFSELERVLAEEPAFHPAQSKREVRIAMTDYTAALVLPGLLERIGKEAPGIDVSVMGIAAAAPYDALREGGCDLLVGMLDSAPTSVETERLWSETFVLLVRKKHPLVRSRRRLDAFAASRHLLVSPRGTPRGRVDEMLAARKRERRVCATLPFFLAAPAIVAESDLVLTIPRKIAERVARRHDVTLLEPPLDLGSFDVSLAWSARLRADPANRWLRGLVASVASRL
jgi:DNA-binding transcriptional LysR family regulator